MDQKKYRHYGGLIQNMGKLQADCVFVPFSITVMGRTTAEAKDFLTQLTAESPAMDDNEILRGLRLHLQMCNGRILSDRWRAWGSRPVPDEPPEEPPDAADHSPAPIGAQHAGDAYAAQLAADLSAVANGGDRAPLDATMYVEMNGTTENEDELNGNEDQMAAPAGNDGASTTPLHPAAE